MSIPKYDIIVDESFLEFFFDSEGPKGKIRKGVVFSPANAFGRTYFNLAFGDLDEATGELNDHSVSNNQDREKVLATVAAAVLIFTEKFPDMAVYATGSTPARTRLYQMSIAANWEIIESVLEIFGFINGRWEKFLKNNKYDAFLALRKKSNFIP